MKIAFFIPIERGTRIETIVSHCKSSIAQLVKNGFRSAAMTSFYSRLLTISPPFNKMLSTN